jgi:hypothetical protein
VADLLGLLGRLAAVPIGALAWLFREKPMHPRGAVYTGVLVRWGSEGQAGSSWLDTAGRHDVVVRLSRGFGLPPWLPDLLGIAVRTPGPDGPPIDLLLTSSGSGRLLRLIPLPARRRPRHYSSIMGYRTDGGTVRLGAVPRGDRVFTLCAAEGGGAWHPFGSLELTAATQPLDPDVRFDAVLHPPPGLVADGPMARFRAPAYAAARRGRDQAREEDG